MGSISNHYRACIGRNTARTVTFTLLASQLDMTAPEVVYCGRHGPLRPIAILLVRHREAKSRLAPTSFIRLFVLCGQAPAYSGPQR